MIEIKDPEIGAHRVRGPQKLRLPQALDPAIRRVTLKLFSMPIYVK